MLSILYDVHNEDTHIKNFLQAYAKKTLRTSKATHVTHHACNGRYVHVDVCKDSCIILGVDLIVVVVIVVDVIRASRVSRYIHIFLCIQKLVYNSS